MKKHYIRGHYIPEWDTTIIFRQTIDKHTGELLEEAITGWYCGEPTEELTKQYSGKLVAKYTMGRKNIIGRVADWFLFLLTGKGPIADEAVDNGIVDYSGQGRDKYGR